jgi:hypothetical protein
MIQSRPFGVSALAILAGFAGVVAAIHTLQFLHLLPFFIGPVAFFGFDLLAALMWGLIAIIYWWVAKMLWEMDPQGWLFVVILASLNLFFDFLALIGGSSLESMIVSIILNAVILVYCLWPTTRQSFAQA